MKSISGKEFAKVLEKHGWQLLRVQGSHHIYGKAGNIAHFSSDTRQSNSQNRID